MPRKQKERIHREWFRAISLNNRKSCPTCDAKFGSESIWSWGEYVIGKWRTVSHFCKECFPAIQQELIAHAKGCGCQFELVSYQGTRLPEWLTIPSIPCPIKEK